MKNEVKERMVNTRKANPYPCVPRFTASGIGNERVYTNRSNTDLVIRIKCEAPRYTVTIINKGKVAVEAKVDSYEQVLDFLRFEIGGRIF